MDDYIDIDLRTLEIFPSRALLTADSRPGEDDKPPEDDLTTKDQPALLNTPVDIPDAKRTQLNDKLLLKKAIPTSAASKDDEIDLKLIEGRIKEESVKLLNWNITTNKTNFMPSGKTREDIEEKIRSALLSHTKYDPVNQEIKKFRIIYSYSKATRDFQTVQEMETEAPFFFINHPNNSYVRIRSLQECYKRLSPFLDDDVCIITKSIKKVFGLKKRFPDYLCKVHDYGIASDEDIEEIFRNLRREFKKEVEDIKKGESDKFDLNHPESIKQQVFIRRFYLTGRRSELPNSAQPAIKN